MNAGSSPDGRGSLVTGTTVAALALGAEFAVVTLIVVVVVDVVVGREVVAEKQSKLYP